MRTDVTLSEEYWYLKWECSVLQRSVTATQRDSAKTEKFSCRITSTQLIHLIFGVNRH